MLYWLKELAHLFTPGNSMKNLFLDGSYLSLWVKLLLPDLLFPLGTIDAIITEVDFQDFGSANQCNTFVPVL